MHDACVDVETGCPYLVLCCVYRSSRLISLAFSSNQQFFNLLWERGPRGRAVSGGPAQSDSQNHSQSTKMFYCVHKLRTSIPSLAAVGCNWAAGSRGLVVSLEPFTILFASARQALMHIQNKLGLMETSEGFRQAALCLPQERDQS